MNNFTVEEFAKLYKKIDQYCIARYGFQPERITIQDDGYLYCYTTDRDGDTTNTAYIDPENLTEDLLEAATKRAAEIEVIRQQREEKARKEKEARNEREKKERLKQYEYLKKEFEGK